MVAERGERLRTDLGLLLQLHASVLEPNLDLPLAELQVVRDFDALLPVQVLVQVELFFQLQRLVTRVSLTSALLAGRLWSGSLISGLRAS